MPPIRHLYIGNTPDSAWDYYGALLTHLADYMRKHKEVPAIRAVTDHPWDGTFSQWIPATFLCLTPNSLTSAQAETYYAGLRTVAEQINPDGLSALTPAHLGEYAHRTGCSIVEFPASE